MRGNGWYQDIIGFSLQRGGVMVVCITFFTELSESLLVSSWINFRPASEAAAATSAKSVAAVYAVGDVCAGPKGRSQRA